MGSSGGFRAEGTILEDAVYDEGDLQAGSCADGCGHPESAIYRPARGAFYGRSILHFAEARGTKAMSGSEEDVLYGRS